MKPKHKAKLEARQKEEARQARRVINGIFFGLIALMVLFLICYYVIFS